jgi:hypothetical protein
MSKSNETEKTRELTEAELADVSGGTSSLSDAIKTAINAMQNGLQTVAGPTSPSPWSGWPIGW